MSQNKYLGLSPVFKITKKHLRPSGVHNARFFRIQDYMNTFKGGLVSHMQNFLFNFYGFYEFLFFFILDYRSDKMLINTLKTFQRYFLK